MILSKHDVCFSMFDKLNSLIIMQTPYFIFLSAKLPIVRQSSNSYFRVSSHCDPYLSITNYFKLKDGILGLSK